MSLLGAENHTWFKSISLPNLIHLDFGKFALIPDIVGKAFAYAENLKSLSVTYQQFPRCADHHDHRRAPYRRSRRSHVVCATCTTKLPLRYTLSRSKFHHCPCELQVPQEPEGLRSGLVIVIQHSSSRCTTHRLRLAPREPQDGSCMVVVTNIYRTSRCSL
jgi:hypothetical protein